MKAPPPESSSSTRDPRRRPDSRTTSTVAAAGAQTLNRVPASSGRAPHPVRRPVARMAPGAVIQDFPPARRRRNTDIDLSLRS